MGAGDAALVGGSLAALAADGDAPVGAARADAGGVTLFLPSVPPGEWVETFWMNPGGLKELDRVDLHVTPPEAFREFLVHRQSDGVLLANGGWDPSRARALRLMPADLTVRPGDGVRVRARAPQWPTPVQMTAVLLWR